MTKEQSLQILIQAAQVGQAKGAYTLQEAKLIAEAMETFIPKLEKPPVAEQGTKEEPKNDTETSNN
jgi:hypothetical protein